MVDAFSATQSPFSLQDAVLHFVETAPDELKKNQRLFACDLDATAVQVHNENLRSQAIQLDLGDRSQPSVASLRPDVVIAGPPCQGFSTLGKRDANDPRNSLLVSAASHAVSMKPKFIVIENVFGAISGALSSYWDSSIRTLQRAGYKTETHPVMSFDYGVREWTREPF